MAEFTKTTSTTYTVNCPACDSDHVVKDGSQSGEQRYKCQSCRKRFRVGPKAEGRKMDAEMMGSAIRDYYTGKSYKQIAEGLKEEYDLPNEPSKATIYEWVKHYTDKALKELKGHKATTGGHWVADEMKVKVGGKQMWLWNVMDSETRYILAQHLTPRRDAQAARVVMRKAANAADKPPKTITTDKLRSYLKPIREILPEARHIQSEGLRADINNNLSERLQGTFRGRIKTLRGMDSRETGQRYLDGWVLTYNNFRGHESLRNKTPGFRAKVAPPFKEWADVVKVEAAPRTRVSKARPVSRPKPKLRPPKVAGRRLREIPAGENGHKARRRRPSIAKPRPPYPKMNTRNGRKRTPLPPWIRQLPKRLQQRISRN